LLLQQVNQEALPIIKDSKIPVYLGKVAGDTIARDNEGNRLLYRFQTRYISDKATMTLSLGN